MLWLTRAQLKAIRSAAIAGSPMEICGFLAGTSHVTGDSLSLNRIHEVYPVENRRKSPTTYFMDPQEQMRIEKQVEANNLTIVGIYHSHPDADAYPSMTDLERSRWEGTDEPILPGASYLIVSLAQADRLDCRSFRLASGPYPDAIREEGILITP